MGQYNVFTRVCHSIHRGVWCRRVSASGCLPRGMSALGLGVWLLAGVSACRVGRLPGGGGGGCTPPEMVTATGGMRPTGMYNCHNEQSQASKKQIRFRVRSRSV